MGMLERWRQRHQYRTELKEQRFYSAVETAVAALDKATNSRSKLSESASPATQASSKNISIQPGQMYACKAPDNDAYYRTLYVTRHASNGSPKVQLSNPIYGIIPPQMEEISPEQALRLLHQSKQNGMKALNALQQPSSFQTDEYKRWAGELPTEAEEAQMDIDMTEALSPSKQQGKEKVKVELDVPKRPHGGDGAAPNDGKNLISTGNVPMGGDGARPSRKGNYVRPMGMGESLSPEQQKAKDAAQSKVNYYKTKSKEGTLSPEDRRKFSDAQRAANSYRRIDVAQKGEQKPAPKQFVPSDPVLAKQLEVSRAAKAERDNMTPEMKKAAAEKAAKQRAEVAAKRAEANKKSDSERMADAYTSPRKGAAGGTRAD